MPAPAPHGSAPLLPLISEEASRARRTAFTPLRSCPTRPICGTRPPLTMSQATMPQKAKQAATRSGRLSLRDSDWRRSSRKAHKHSGSLSPANERMPCSDRNRRQCMLAPLSPFSYSAQGIRSVRLRANGSPINREFSDFPTRRRLRSRWARRSGRPCSRCTSKYPQDTDDF